MTSLNGFDSIPSYELMHPMTDNPNSLALINIKFFPSPKLQDTPRSGILLSLRDILQSRSNLGRSTRGSALADQVDAILSLLRNAGTAFSSFFEGHRGVFILETLADGSNFLVAHHFHVDFGGSERLRLVEGWRGFVVLGQGRELILLVRKT